MVITAVLQVKRQKTYGHWSSPIPIPEWQGPGSYPGCHSGLWQKYYNYWGLIDLSFLLNTMISVFVDEILTASLTSPPSHFILYQAEFFSNFPGFPLAQHRQSTLPKLIDLRGSDLESVLTDTPALSLTFRLMLLASWNFPCFKKSPDLGSTIKGADILLHCLCASWQA